MDDLPSDWDVMLIGALGLVHPERKYGLCTLTLTPIPTLTLTLTPTPTLAISAATPRTGVLRHRAPCALCRYGLWWLVHFLPQLLFLPSTGMRWRT